MPDDFFAIATGGTAVADRPPSGPSFFDLATKVEDSGFAKYAAVEQSPEQQREQIVDSMGGGAGDYLANLAIAGARGAGRTIGLGVQGVGQMARRGLETVGLDPDLYDYVGIVKSIEDTGRNIQQASTEGLPTPRIAGTIPEALSEGLGSVAGIAPAAMAGPVGLAGAGASIGYAATYNNVKELGGTEREAKQYAAASALVGAATEPFGALARGLKVLRRAEKATGGWIGKEILKAGGAEALQETLQEIPDEVARKAYIKDRTLWDSARTLAETGALSGTIGMIVGGISSAPAMYRAIRDANKGREATPTPQPEGLTTGEPLSQAEAEQVASGIVGAVPSRKPLDVVPVEKFLRGDVTEDARYRGAAEAPGIEARPTGGISPAEAALLQDYNERKAAGQKDPMPTADMFEQAGHGRPPRKQRPAVVQKIEEKRNAQNEVEAQAQAQARTEAQGQETGQAQGSAVLSPDIVAEIYGDRPAPPPQEQGGAVLETPPQPAAKPVAIGDMQDWAKTGTTYTLRQVLPKSMHKQFASVLDTQVLKIEGFVAPAGVELRGTGESIPGVPRAMFRVMEDADAAKWSSRGIKQEHIVLTEHSSARDLAEEALHAMRHAKGRPMGEDVAEPPAKKGAAFFEQQMQPAAKPVEGEGVSRPEQPIGAVNLGELGGVDVGRVKAFIKRFWTAKGNLPEEAFTANLARDAKAAALIREATFADADLRKAEKREFGGATPDTAIVQIDRVLKGESASSVLPESLRESVDRLRRQVDALSQHLIDIGAVEGDLAATVEANKGVYLHRSYRAFDDPKWAESVPQAVRNKAKAFIRQEYPDLTEQEVEGQIGALLFKAQDAGTPIGVLKQAQLGAKDLSILTRRKNIPPEIRALWGEYNDPHVNYLKSIGKMAHLIANHEFLSSVRQSGMGKWLHEKPIVNDDGRFVARIAATGDRTMWPLDGLYTTPEIKQAFEEMAQGAPEALVWWLRPIMAATYTAKYAKTLLSPMSQIRNIVGNAGIMLASGHYRVWNSAKALKAIAADIGITDNTKWREELNDAIRHGVVGQNARGNELKAAIRDVLGADDPTSQLTSPLIARALRKGARAAEKMYGWGDDAYKMVGWHNEQAAYRKAYPDWTEEQLKEHTAEIIRNTYPTYSMIPQAIKLARRVPLLGSFQSFAAEILRLGYTIPRQIARELGSDNPKVKLIGARRLAGFVAAMTLLEGVIRAMMQMFGIMPEQDEDIRHFVAPWQENSDFLHLGEVKDATYRLIDASYTDPWNYLKRPFTAFLRGDNPADGMVDAMKELAAPFLGEGLIAERLIDLARNSTDSGRPVYNPQDDPANIAQAIVAHVTEPMEPGLITSARRIHKGVTGFVEPSGRTYDPAVEALAMFSGHRIQDIDIKQGLGYRASDFDKNLDGATDIYRQVAGRRGTVTEQELRNARERSESARREVFNKFRATVLAAERLGVTEQEISKTLKARGIPAKMVSALLDDRYSPYELSREIRGRVREIAGRLDIVDAVESTP